MDSTTAIINLAKEVTKVSHGKDRLEELIERSNKPDMAWYRDMYDYINWTKVSK